MFLQEKASGRVLGPSARKNRARRQQSLEILGERDSNGFFDAHEISEITPDKSLSRYLSAYDLFPHKRDLNNLLSNSNGSFVSQPTIPLKSSAQPNKTNPTTAVTTPSKYI